MRYAQRLRDLREGRNLTQENVAKTINTSQSYYAQYENEKKSYRSQEQLSLPNFIMFLLII